MIRPRDEEEEPKREWQGTWIPKWIWTNPDLTWMEKCLLGEIGNLESDKWGGCFAGNGFLAEKFETSPGSIAKTLSKLRSLGFIEDVSFDGRKRVIRVSSTFTKEEHQGLPSGKGGCYQAVNHRVQGKEQGRKKKKNPEKKKNKASSNSRNGKGGSLLDDDQDENSKGKKDRPGRAKAKVLVETLLQYLAARTGTVRGTVAGVRGSAKEYSKWIQEMMSLLHHYNGNYPRIFDAMTYYCNHTEGGYRPRVYDARMFRLKFLKIEDWIEKQKSVYGANDEYRVGKSKRVSVGPTKVMDDDQPAFEEEELSEY